MTRLFGILTFFLIININAQDYPDLIKVDGGTFLMGNDSSRVKDDQKPVHEVTLKDFYIGKTEVTVAQYRLYCNETGVKMPNKPSWGWEDNHPIVNVNWQDAMNYCKWLSEKLGIVITLPTEAEWEFAAKGGNQSEGFKYSGSFGAGVVGWFRDNTDGGPEEVATKKPNELGIYDMTGNAYEWCLDYYDRNYYAKSPVENPMNNRTSRFRVLRGGCWYCDFYHCTVTHRYRNVETSIRDDNGFRICTYKTKYVPE
jgi:formylglycine-generating enzyme required for sulfatase activity